MRGAVLLLLLLSGCASSPTLESRDLAFGQAAQDAEDCWVEWFDDARDAEACLRAWDTIEFRNPRERETALGEMRARVRARVAPAPGSQKAFELALYLN